MESQNSEMNAFSVSHGNDHSFSHNNAMAVEEAAFAGIKSAEKLMEMITEQKNKNQQQQEQHGDDVDTNLNVAVNNDGSSIGEIAGAAVSKFKEVISLLDENKPKRLGHARFRRAPLTITAPPQAHTLQFQISDSLNELRQQKPGKIGSNPSAFKVYRPTPIRIPPPALLPQENSHDDYTLISTQPQQNKIEEPSNNDFSTFELSKFSSIVSASNSHMSALPPAGSLECEPSTGRCHCSGKRCKKIKRTVIRVPATSDKNDEIPISDEYSWRKYGQKPIKGAPHPRGYYRCSTVKGCTARKRVERSAEEPNIFVITYEAEHNHSTPPHATPRLVNKPIFRKTS